MSKRKPLALVIEFDDGSKTSVSYEVLPYQLQCELLRQPFASGPDSDSSSDKFVLMEWEDGWKEVVNVGEHYSSVGRYYVISRTEEVGRLTLVNGNGYPELIEVRRKPSTVARITFENTFYLSPGSSHREGKNTDHFFELTKAEDAIAQAVEELKRALEAEKIEPSDLQAGEWRELRGLYERIRRKTGIAAAYRQQDAYDFIAHLLQKAGITTKWMHQKVKTENRLQAKNSADPRSLHAGDTKAEVCSSSGARSSESDERRRIR